MISHHCVLLRCVLLPKYPHCTMHNRNDVFKLVFFLFMPSPLSVVWCDGCIEFHLCYYHTVTALSMVVQVMGLVSGVSCLILSPFIIVIGTSYFIDSNHEGIKTFGSVHTQQILSFVRFMPAGGSCPCPCFSMGNHDCDRCERTTWILNQMMRSI